MVRTRLRTQALVCALLGWLVIAGGLLFAQDQAQVVRVLVPVSNSALPLLVMAQADPVEGIDLQAQLFVNQAQALVALLRGEAELMLTGTSQGWENYLAGGPLYMIDSGVWGVSYLMGRPGLEGVVDFRDLRGKRLALPFPGSPLDFQTRFLLRLAGLDPDRDLSISYAPFPQSSALMQKGLIDVAPVPEPLATQMQLNQGLERLLSYASAWAQVSGGDPRSPQLSLFATRAYGHAHFSLLSELIDAWRRASLWVQENPAEAARRFHAQLGIPSEVVEASVSRTLFEVPSPEENRLRVQAYFRRLGQVVPGIQGELQQEFFFPSR
jgi:NitT/TauT family transport system substrate-binding protein